MSQNPAPVSKTRITSATGSPYAGVGRRAWAVSSPSCYLFAMDVFARVSNPYMGILAYIIAPSFLFFGLGMVGLGAWWQRRNEKRAGVADAVPAVLHVDFSRPADRKKLRWFVVGSVVFLLLHRHRQLSDLSRQRVRAVLRQTCHEPMKPRTRHINIRRTPGSTCVACHVGHGADAYIKAKMNGVHQLVGVMTGNYRPAHQDAGQRAAARAGNL
jgi:hypothetical protein